MATRSDPSDSDDFDLPARGRRGDATTADAVTATLRSRISTHVLPPGSRIQEVELAREFNVSRARVREALGMLEQRGLIERIPNRGAIVTRLEPREIFEIFDVREVLEGLAVRLATINAPDQTWTDLIHEFGDPMARKIESGDTEAYLTTLEELRGRTIHWAGSTTIANLLDLLLDKQRVIARRVTILPGRAEFGRQLHQKMVMQMAARQSHGAETTKREIIRSAREWLDRYRSFIL